MNKLGFIANIFAWNGVTDIERVVQFARTENFDTLELGPTYPLADPTVRAIRDTGLTISNLIYCRNALSPDQRERTTHIAEIKRRIDFASDVEIPLVVLCGGYGNLSADASAKDSYSTVRALPESNLEMFLSVYGPMADHAAKRGVKLAFEHCPIMGNWLISPRLWALAFDQLDAPHVGLAFDPSHLVWLFVDAYQVAAEWAPRIFHVHAKDTELYRGRLAREGILTDFDWWENRLPGFGELNWPRLLGTLIARGYDGAISIEHEDPDWNGTIELVEEGLCHARDFVSRALRIARASDRQGDRTIRPKGLEDVPGW
jgi:sugar phosphate isomerase/epimerase